MIRILCFIFIGLICNVSIAQSKKSVIIQKKDSLSNWKKKNRIGLDVSEVAFVNWNAGGSNSISGLINFECNRNYKTINTLWDNRLIARYGINKQQSQDFRKTDDVLEVSSTFGYKSNPFSNWYYSANFSFKTQFSNGFDYAKSKELPISKFMAPAYLFLGIGTSYGQKKQDFKAYLSPFTLKATFVLDQKLANIGSFGVKAAQYDSDGVLIEEGEKSRQEFGILIRSSYETELMKNISLRNLIHFYTDYLNEFGNVDIDWELVFNFKVNDFFKATLGSHLIYDDDIKIAANESKNIEASGAKVQWKQILGVGVVYDF